MCVRVWQDDDDDEYEEYDNSTLSASPRPSWVSVVALAARFLSLSLSQVGLSRPVNKKKRRRYFSVSLRQSGVPLRPQRQAAMCVSLCSS